MSLLDKINNTGELPTVNTSVTIESSSLINLAIALVLVAAVSMVVFKLLFKK